MDKDTDDYYNNLFEMFATKGWKQLQEELEASVTTIEKTALYSDKDREAFEVSRGRAMTLRQLIGYENAMRQTYDQMREEE